MHSLCGRAPDRHQPLCNNAHATIPQRRLFRCEATTTAQYSLAFLTLLLRAVPVLVDHDCLAATLAYDWCSSLQGWRRRGGKPSASLLPHSEILVPEQLVTTTGNPAMARVPLRATNGRGADLRALPRPSDLHRLRGLALHRSLRGLRWRTPRALHRSLLRALWALLKRSLRGLHRSLR